EDRGGKLTDEMIHQCRLTLDVLAREDGAPGGAAARTDPTPPHGLEPLAVGADDLPPLAGDCRPVARACRDSFVAAARPGRWDELRGLLDDMSHFMIDVEGVAGLGRWLSWVDWYHEVCSRTSTWGELARGLDGRLTPPDSPAELAHVCRPVS